MKIVILDTQCSNLLSIKIAIKKLGYFPIITNNVYDIKKADKLFLPGVGSASEIMKQLYKNDLVNIIKNITCPVLGICLGMQILSHFSEESNGIEMIGVINIPVLLLNTGQLPLPHTGWNQIFFNKNNILFKNIHSGAWFYFLHSYGFPVNDYTIAKTLYHTYFSAVIQKKNFFGVQFHPEKSGEIGAKLMLNFLEI